MQIIIPMSGIGKRFIDAGYKVPKPLIEVEGKPIIEHVINLFPGEENFLFICNRDHIANTFLMEVLKRKAPKGKTIAIEPHKRGPVHAILEAEDYIADNQEAIVNYCDFFTYWNYEDFLGHTRNRRSDGAIPAYKGFHPHMLSSPNYAFIRDKEQYLLEIKEKEPFTDNRMQEYASNGTYYFRRGDILKRYCKETIESDVSINGEYYVSLVYGFLVGAGLKVSVYEVQHMFQWGVPQDLEEYVRWSNCFKRLVGGIGKGPSEKNSINLIPLAGEGKRFLQEGYAAPKPLVKASGEAMIIQAARSLPDAERNIFVCRKEHLESFPLEEALEGEYPLCSIKSVDKLTEGQAVTCAIGLEGEDLESPLFIGACDNGIIYDVEEYQNLLDDDAIDVIVWSFRKNPCSKRNPKMYGWIKVEEGNRVKGVSVKEPISDDPYNDHAIVGSFYFRKAKLFIKALESLRRNNTRVNGEFYVDSCIHELVAMHFDVRVFEVDEYICWGTPDDLRTFEYWQSCFHKWKGHPYRLESDSFFKKEEIKETSERYHKFSQVYV